MPPGRPPKKRDASPSSGAKATPTIKRKRANTKLERTGPFSSSIAAPVPLPAQTDVLGGLFDEDDDVSIQVASAFSNVLSSANQDSSALITTSKANNVGDVSSSSTSKADQPPSTATGDTSSLSNGGPTRRKLSDLHFVRKPQAVSFPEPVDPVSPFRIESPQLRTPVRTPIHTRVRSPSVPGTPQRLLDSAYDHDPYELYLERYYAKQREQLSNPGGGQEQGASSQVSLDSADSSNGSAPRREPSPEPRIEVPSGRREGVCVSWDSERKTGILRDLTAFDKGFGKVTCHYSALVFQGDSDLATKKLTEGDVVEFDYIVGLEYPDLEAANVIMVTPFITLRRRGVVSMFDNEKRFGFIDDPQPHLFENKRVFVHCHQILTENRTLSTGDQVEYKVEKGPKGFVATAVVQMGASDASQILARLANGEDVSAMSDQQELRRRKDWNQEAKPLNINPTSPTAVSESSTTQPDRSGCQSSTSWFGEPQNEQSKWLERPPEQSPYEDRPRGSGWAKSSEPRAPQESTVVVEQQISSQPPKSSQHSPREHDSQRYPVQQQKTIQQENSRDQQWESRPISYVQRDVEPRRETLVYSTPIHHPQPHPQESYVRIDTLPPQYQQHQQNNSSTGSCCQSHWSPPPPQVHCDRHPPPSAMWVEQPPQGCSCHPSPIHAPYILASSQPHQHTTPQYVLASSLPLPHQTYQPTFTSPPTFAHYSQVTSHHPPPTYYASPPFQNISPTPRFVEVVSSLQTGGVGSNGSRAKESRGGEGVGPFGNM